MEVALLIVLVLLLVIFQTGTSSKLSNVEEELKRLKTGQQRIQKTLDLSIERNSVKDVRPAAAAVVREVPPVVKPEVQKDQVIPPAVTEKPKAPVPPTPIYSKTPDVKPVPPPKPVFTEKKIPVAPQPSWYEGFRERNPDLEKFIGENILSKIAITILVLGIGFFVKYAIDKDWINEIARVGIGILCGGIVMGFAHRLRKRFASFSSVLVAGAIAIFYFTIGIGFHEYHLFNQTVAFSLMLLITIFAVVISMAYDRMELAVLSLVGGFAAPFMVSTGEGNYQVLFTYVLILDAGMLVLAYFRKWNLVNILSFVFTILLYAAWVQTKVINHAGAPHAGALFFGASFYFLFMIMNMINSLKSERLFDRFEISILLSNTFLFYLLGMQILGDWRPDFQGLFSIAMAIINLLTAVILYKRFKADRKVVFALIGLTLSFVTIAGPVQLEGNYISLFYALESLLLLWLAQKSEMLIYRFSSVPVMIFSVLTLISVWMTTYFYIGEHSQYPIIFNKGFLTSVFCAMTLFVQQFLLAREIKAAPYGNVRFSYLGMDYESVFYRLVLKTLMLAVLYIAGIQELNYQLKNYSQSDSASLIVIACYHLIWLIALHLLYGKTVHLQFRKTLLFLSAASLLFYVLIIVMLPLKDFMGNLFHNSRNPLGLISHYVALAAALVLAFLTKKLQERTDGDFLRSSPLMLSGFLMVSAVYICSIELLLHAYWLNVQHLVGTGTAEMSLLVDQVTSTRQTMVKVGFPIFWGLLSFIFLTMGMKRNNRVLRIGALLLIAIILIKLFTYDISNASEAGKIIAFIILGIVLLIISFLYQKIKALVVNDEKTES